ncbi:MAG TPA: glycine cleavage T C-terminal barrel domain-containing protein [Solirubrobacteraceae bacterium]
MSSVAPVKTDYETVTEGCGLFDRSERGKLALSGPEAATFLQGQVSNDVEAISPGSGCYAAFLTPKGKMLGDARILATDDELLLDTERSTLQALFNMVHRSLVGFRAELHKRTLERALVSLVGPQSASVAGLPALDGAPEHAHVDATLGGVTARAIRTDVGIDLLCPSDDLGAIQAALRDLGARDVAEEAVECLRVESGRPRYGIDLDETVIPEEAGLNERAVSFTKGCYVGQETVARLHWRGKPNRHLRGLRLSGPAGSGDALLLGERPVGRLGSVAASPRFGPIALALVRREAEPGSEVTVGDPSAPATVVELPFGGRSPR